MCGTMARPTATQDSEPVVLTVGHSTRALAEFVALLKEHSVARLIDVRTVPRSRHNPQFDRETLPAALAVHGIGYEHVAGLGGFRRTHPGSLNTGWRNVSSAVSPTACRPPNLPPIWPASSNRQCGSESC